MQDKGKLGSVVAGIIAVFLVIVCLFYLSFSFVSSSYEKKAEQFAQNLQKTTNKLNDDNVYNQAYKHYMDSVGEEKVYAGLYTLNDVRKWGVGLGLDLKGGMNVILEVDMPDMLRSISYKAKDANFEAAIDSALAVRKAAPSSDFFETFMKVYRGLEPTIDLSVVFKDNLVPAGS
ncbi:MAG: hypothetical protein NC548_57110, partial [Lachnospiraceae bacterium]|nr:hypothetical protein [Lachnospiraceae bacterium]